MALALYRKYRPRTFAEVIGQEHVTEPLSQALRSGRLHHAYLFSGPRGCGKTSSARILARSLNCEKGPTPDPCGECESCRNLAPDGPGSIDVIEIDAASHGGVDDARDLRERAFFAPVASRFKVYVIDEAHMVSTQGFNALLKLVEEPPEYVTFVFATTEPEKVLGTIKSRTHHYPFRLIPPGVLRPYLEELCAREKVSVEPPVFPLVVRAGGGSARDSLSVLDQLIAGAGDEGVTYARAVALLGVTDVALIDEMCDALAAGDGAAAYVTIDRVAEAGHEPRRFAADLLERMRDLIVLQQVPDAVSKGLLDAPADQLDRMSTQAQRFGPGSLSRMADIVHNGLVEMRGTTAPRLLLELITARMLLPGADDSAGALLHRLERMERRLGAAEGPPEPRVASTSAPARPHPSTAAPVSPSRPAAPGPSSEPAATAGQPSAASALGPESAGPAAPASLAPDAGAGGALTEDSGDEEPHPAGPAVRAPVDQSGGAPVEISSPAVAASGVMDAAGVRRVWDEVLAMVARKSKRVAALVRDATVRDVEGDTLVLVFRHQVHADMLASAPELLLEAVYEVIGGRWKVRCVVGGDQRGSLPAPAQPSRSAVAPSQSRSEPAPAAPAAEDDGWPTPAPLGGAGSAPAGPAEAPTVPKKKATRAKAAGRGGRSTPAASAPAASSAWGDGPAPDEPPYDPEYDGPPRSAVSYEGFAPGDEPTDDVVDEATARQTSEQQALTLLQEALGAEKIGEVDHR